MSETEEKPKWCWQEEYKQWADDCGARYCTLTENTWYTWNYEDDCQDCTFVIWNEDEWEFVHAEDRE